MECFLLEGQILNPETSWNPYFTNPNLKPQQSIKWHKLTITKINFKQRMVLIIFCVLFKVDICKSPAANYTLRSGLHGSLLTPIRRFEKPFCQPGLERIPLTHLSWWLRTLYSAQSLGIIMINAFCGSFQYWFVFLTERLVYQYALRNFWRNRTFNSHRFVKRSGW